MTGSDIIKKCWCWPDTDTDSRIGAILTNSLNELTNEFKLSKCWLNRSHILHVF